MSPRFGTIPELLAARVSRDPERAALRAPDRPDLTYRELDATATRARQALAEGGIVAGDRVALVLPNGPEAAAAFLAVASSASCAPLNPLLREEEIAFALADLRVRAVLLGAESPPAAAVVARRLGLPILSLRAEAGGGAGSFEIAGDTVAAAAAPPRPPSAADVALVLHTSGTTARPKAVPLTHANLAASAANVAGVLALGAADTCLNVMPLFHIHGLVGALLASLAAGGSVICTAGFRATAFAAWLRDLEPTWYTAVPTIHQAVVEAFAGTPAPATSRLRFVRSSSAALPVRLMSDLERLFGVPVVEAYGMTEAAHQMASNPVEAGRQKPGSVGPAAGPEVAVMDEHGALLDRGATGELVIRGETVMRGYEHDEEANAAAFASGWFRTGDQGYIDDDGYVFLTGRLKELINRGGEKIAPREVEEALLAHPAVAQAVAFAMPHPRLGEEVAAAVVLRPGGEAGAEDLRRAAGERLAYFKVPRRLEIVAEIPKGPTGKVQRGGLARALGLDAATAGGRLPRTAREQQVAAAWSRLLGGEPVGIDDDFFALGGDSLAAVEMLEAMNEELGIEVPSAEFLERPTISGLLALLDAGGDSLPAEIVPIRRRGSGRPVFATALHDGSFWRVGRLLRHFELDRPIYGLRPPAVEARALPPSIEELARRYTGVIERVQAHGPVCLVGPCFGGAVALEMAIQLGRRGREVELLVLVNSFNRSWARGRSRGAALAVRARHLRHRMRQFAQRLRERGPAESLAYLRGRAVMARDHWLEEGQRVVFELAVAAGAPLPGALRQVRFASRHAQRRYVPGRCAERVLVVASQAPIAGVYPLPRSGWGDVLAGEVESLALPGEQLEFWANDEQLRRVAARIGEILAAGGPAGGIGR